MHNMVLMRLLIWCRRFAGFKMEIQHNKTFSTIEEALLALKNKKPIIVVDDEDRENEGDLIFPAETITEQDIAFMLQHTSGIICVPCYSDRLDHLKIPLMVHDNTSKHGCAFTVSVDAATVHTGVSAADRLQTIRVLASKESTPVALVQPGHIFPLRAAYGGVLKRVGHTEAAVDFCVLAGFQPIGVLAELMNSDGTMMRLPHLTAFSQQHHIPLVRIADLVAYRRQKEHLVVRQDAIHLPSRFGDFTLIPYKETNTDTTHLVIMKGDVSGKKNVLVRVHSECLTGDVFGSQRCDCGDQLAVALELIEKEELGVVLYMRQEGRGIGLLHKLQAYHLQEKGFDTVEANKLLGFTADLRDYGTGAQILSDLGLTSLRLLTNNPKKVVGLEGYGLMIVGRVALQMQPNIHNKAYLNTKKEKLGHLFEHL